MTTNGHARHDSPTSPPEMGHSAPEYLVIVHPAGGFRAPPPAPPPAAGAPPRRGPGAPP